uniref:Uncharacterized protein LOC102800592 n=1 Tax=Saccoglossus kowalevskii TaxID=10224 RepID=A0ABM0M7R8_SACKO|nr:PREDICTED: uncharacterized protein LOC102800592 [Saccoglossus kowalevskii]
MAFINIRSWTTQEVAEWMKESLLASSYSLFEDVVEEFSTFEGIKPHFEKWKHQYSDSYKEAYISLCLPKLFSPFIRLQLLNWNPLEPHCVDIEEMRWFESLIFYGFREYDGIDKEDLDNKLMPSLVEKVILPKLTCLNENVGQYIEQFVNQGVTGEKLLRITQQDLQEVEMRKIGHQEIFFECLNLIRSLYYVMENENLQSLALSLSCKANNLKSLIKCNGYCHQYSENSKTLSNDVLALIVDVVMATRTLVSWLDRTPFYGIDYFSNARETVVSQCLQLTEMVHMDSHATDLENAILPLSIEIVELCNKLIKDTKDPLVIQPAHLELVTLKKIKPEEGLGLLIKATYEGEHIITGTKEQSAADLSRKVHQGDEILQVNYRTVVGWQLSKVVEAMKEDPNEVTLTLKKRPKNVSLQGQIIVKRSVLNSSTANVKKKHSHTAPGRRRQSSNEKRLKSPLEQLFIPPPPDEPYSPRTARNLKVLFTLLLKVSNVFFVMVSDETLHSSLTPPDSPNFQLDRQVSFHQTEPDPLLQYHTRRCTVSEVTLRNKSNNILNRTQNSNGRPTSLPADNKELEEIANIEVENWTSIPTDKKTSSNISNVIIESKPSPEILKNDEAIKLSNNVEHTDEKQSNHSNHRLIKTSSCEHMIELNVEISDDLLTDRKNGEVGITQRSSFRIVTDDYTMKKNTPKKDINENTSSKKMCEKPVSDTVDVHSTFKLQDPPKSKIVNSASKDSMKISNGAVDSNVESGIVDGSAGSSVVDTKAGSGVADSSVGSSVVDSSVGSSVVDSSVGSSVVDSSVGSSVVDSSVGSSVVDSSVGSSVVDSSVGSSVVDSNAEKHIEQDNIVSQNVTSLEHKENEQTSDSKTLDSQLGESQVLHMPDPTSSNVSNASMPSRVSECTSKLLKSLGSKVKGQSKISIIDRRISCKNLGVGECQGWLWKKEERKGFGNKWNKRWFVLKEYSLFYYKERSSLRATGVISLPGYRVSPAAHSETKRQL